MLAVDAVEGQRSDTIGLERIALAVIVVEAERCFGRVGSVVGKGFVGWG